MTFKHLIYCHQQFKQWEKSCSRETLSGLKAVRWSFLVKPMVLFIYLFIFSILKTEHRWQFTEMRYEIIIKLNYFIYAHDPLHIHIHEKHRAVTMSQNVAWQSEFDLLKAVLCWSLHQCFLLNSLLSKIDDLKHFFVTWGARSVVEYFHRKTITVDKNDLKFHSPCQRVECHGWLFVAEESFLILEIDRKSDFFGIFGESQCHN